MTIQHPSVTYLLGLLAPAMFALAAVAGEPTRDWSAYPMQAGQFVGTWESLEKYECPQWFRDAKFGIWAIIGPQCVPMQGDWYARNMYIQGHRQYEYHVKTYGHPSKFGYKDLIEQFNPTQLDFDKLVGLYKQAGAKYVVILAVHHDNFDLWNSKYHEWNSVNKGPKRDLVGEFRDAAAKHGVRFGVTTHLARSYSWLQTSHGADKTGPLAGVPYDGADPRYQSLYHPPFPESSRYPSHPPEAWKREWYLRVKDLIDQYRPDLMYFDGGYPFDDGAVGRRLVAHYYNINSTWHNGRNDAAMCIKSLPTEHGVFRIGTCVRDIERGKTDSIAEHPWQTDTCIGGWYYRTGTRYKTVPDIVRMLIDIVSKNGNLLLNIPLHPGGSIDEQEQDILKGLGQWMAVNGDGLYGTRPWVIFGEGPSLRRKAAAHRFGGIADVQAFRPGDIRFACKGDTELFAFLMAWPQAGEITIRSLATPYSTEARIDSVQMLGVNKPLEFQQTDDGLVVGLPQVQPCEHAWALRITGRALHSFSPRQVLHAIEPAADGSLLLGADDAMIHGRTPRVEKKPNADKSNIGFWDSATDWVSWRVKIPKTGAYRVTARISSQGRATPFVVELDDQRVEAESIRTGSWAEFVPVEIGQLTAGGPGLHTLSVKPLSVETWKPIGLLEVKLVPVATSRSSQGEP